MDRLRKRAFSLGAQMEGEVRHRWKLACDQIDLNDPRDPVTGEPLIRRPDDNLSSGVTLHPA